MAEERLQPISLHQEMQRSYLEYAMSVIVGRALPDARDGLKPVQRRILYAMHELGLTPDRPYRKSARVVGDVLGKYHPHGDQAVYDALVRLIQSFSSRYPVLDGHGNFGSVDDDPPAAMRYTETRLASIAYEGLLNEIGNDTVHFIANFDGSQQEPTVLPAQLPFLLLNGCSGIAVGMATSIPPHNLNEVVDGLIALLKKPNTTDEKLLEIIPGPDFPTGGEVLLGTGIKETYLKGRGSIPMRGITHIEEINPGKGKHKRNAIIITELPFQLSKAGWIEKVADLVNESKISGIADIRDESDREGMRIVIELRRDSDADEITKLLHRKTALQSNFGAILLALVNGQPKQLSLRKLLETFLSYRELTLTKRTKYELRKTKERLNILKGLIVALNNLKKVIALIQDANDASMAKAKLIVSLDVNEKQSEAILAMPLRRLTGLEQMNLRKEEEDLIKKETSLEVLLQNREKLIDELIKELRVLKKKFGNPRKTILKEGGDELIAEKIASQRPNTELQRQQALASLPKEGKLVIQDDNEVKVITPQLFGKLQLKIEKKLSEDWTPIKLVVPISKETRVLAITKLGRVAIVRWEFAGKQPGNINNFLPTGIEGEEIINLLDITGKNNHSLGLLSTDGRFKRIPMEEVLELSGRASTILKLKDNVYLKSAVICKERGLVLIATNIGRVLKLKVNSENLPLMGKLAQGPIAMRLIPGEELIEAISLNNNLDNNLLVGTANGKIVKLSLSNIRECRRGDLGVLPISINNTKKDKDEMISICESDCFINLTTSKHRKAILNGKSVLEGRGNIMQVELNEGEKLLRLKPLIIKDI